MTTYTCRICGWVYLPSDAPTFRPPGDVGSLMPEAFEDLSDEYSCPQCGACHAEFLPTEDRPTKDYECRLCGWTYSFAVLVGQFAGTQPSVLLDRLTGQWMCPRCGAIEGHSPAVRRHRPK